MDKMVAKLDRLYPKIKIGKHCHMCNKPATDVHHIVRRDNYVLRFDLNNLLPLCRDCHRLIHDKGEDVLLYISWSRAEYLRTLKNIQLQDYLLINGLTKEEFFKRKERELLEEICNV